MEHLKYKLINHSSDIGINVYGKSLAELFENGGYALFDLITDITDVDPKIDREMRIKAEQIDLLFHDWLSELLFLFYAENMLFKQFKFKKLDYHSLESVISGEVFDPMRHIVKREIKSVTYHKLEVKRVGGLWRSTVIFDV